MVWISLETRTGPSSRGGSQTGAAKIHSRVDFACSSKWSSLTTSISYTLISSFVVLAWVRCFWDHFISRFGVCWVQPDSLKNLLCWWPKQDLDPHKKGGKKMWCLILAALCWAIWEERNRRIFEGVSKESRFVLDATLSRIYNWLYVTQNREGPPYRAWIFDWDPFTFHD